MWGTEGEHEKLGAGGAACSPEEQSRQSQRLATTLASTKLACTQLPTHGQPTHGSPTHSSPPHGAPDTYLSTQGEQEAPGLRIRDCGSAIRVYAQSPSSTALAAPTWVRGGWLSGSTVGGSEEKVAGQCFASLHAICLTRLARCILRYSRRARDQPGWRPIWDQPERLRNQPG